MKVLRHGVLPYLAMLGVLVVASGGAAAEWPSAFDYTIGVSTDKGSGMQVSGSFSGKVLPDVGLKVGGWWITRSTNNRAFVGDAYLDYTKVPIYVAVGRKFVPFGPAGVLVSPGIYGGEAKLSLRRLTLQAIGGDLAFTPVTGGTRFTYAGNRVPSDVNLGAARAALLLTEPGAELSATVGVNMINVLHDTGQSADFAFDLTKTLNLFGEAASYHGVDAHAYGIRISDEKVRVAPNLATILVFYHRKVPVGFVPAALGATAYFENQEGWAGGLYQELPRGYAVGLFADKNDAILTLFGHMDL